MQTRVEHNRDVKRFVLYVDDSEAGYTTYREAGTNRAFTHTEIYPRFEGLGLSKVLVRAALDATRDEGLGVLPMCRNVHRFVSKRPEYLALVPADRRAELNLPLEV